MRFSEMRNQRNQCRFTNLFVAIHLFYLILKLGVKLLHTWTWFLKSLKLFSLGFFFVSPSYFSRLRSWMLQNWVEHLTLTRVQHQTARMNYSRRCNFYISCSSGFSVHTGWDVVHDWGVELHFSAFSHWVNKYSISCNLSMLIVTIK